jgi:hypothetical protein
MAEFQTQRSKRTRGPKLAFTGKDWTYSKLITKSTNTLTETYHACIALAVTQMILQNTDAAIHYFDIAVQCRDVVAAKFGGHDAGHARIRDEIARELQNVVDFRETGGEQYKFMSKLLVGNAMDANVEVPTEMLPDGFDYAVYCKINEAQELRKKVTAM